MEDLTASLRIEKLLTAIDPSFYGMRDVIQEKPFQTIIDVLKNKLPNDAEKFENNYMEIKNLRLTELQDNGFDVEKLIRDLKLIVDGKGIEKGLEGNPYIVKPKIALSDKSLKFIDIIFLACYIAGIAGVVIFLGIVIIGAIVYGRVYLFDGYAFTKALAIISIVLMLIGFISVIAKIITSIVFKIGNFPKSLIKKILLILLAVSCLSFSIWGFVDCAKTEGKGSDSSSSNSSSGSGSSTVSMYLGLSLKVTNITTKGSYTYVYCSIQNVSSLYGNATMYCYVKVKAVFYNSANVIVDTDWTYAIDSAWLNPGESKTFYFMVRDTSVKSAKLSIIS